MFRALVNRRVFATGLPSVPWQSLILQHKSTYLRRFSLKIDGKRRQLSVQYKLNLTKEELPLHIFTIKQSIYARIRVLSLLFFKKFSDMLRFALILSKGINWYKSLQLIFYCSKFCLTLLSKYTLKVKL